MQYTKAFNIFTYINGKAKFYKISCVKEMNTTCTIMNLSNLLTLPFHEVYQLTVKQMNI